MKFTLLTLAAMASAAVLATPTLEAPKDTSAANVFVRDDCKSCDDYYQKCRGVSILLAFPSKIE
jgi:hypothetical protein